MYPKMYPEAAYQIDSLIEMSDSFLGKMNFEYVFKGPVSEEKAKELCSGPWRDLLCNIDEQLAQNSNPNFLVGNSMTTADVSLGAFPLKHVDNVNHPHRQIYAMELRKFPRVNNWASNTIAPAFSLWFKSEPIAPA